MWCCVGRGAAVSDASTIWIVKTGPTTRKPSVGPADELDGLGE